MQSRYGYRRTDLNCEVGAFKNWYTKQRFKALYPSCGTGGIQDDEAIIQDMYDVNKKNNPFNATSLQDYLQYQPKTDWLTERPTVCQTDEQTD